MSSLNENQDHQYWTDKSNKAYKIRMNSDFVAQLEKYMEEQDIEIWYLSNITKISRDKLENILEKPWKLKTKHKIKIARALNLHVTCVLYNTHVNENKYPGAPVNCQIFDECWKLCQSPMNFFTLEELKIAIEEAAE